MAAETVSGNLIAKKKTFKWLEFHCQNQAIGNIYSTIIARNLRRSQAMGNKTGSSELLVMSSCTRKLTVD